MSTQLAKTLQLLSEYVLVISSASSIETLYGMLSHLRNNCSYIEIKTGTRLTSDIEVISNFGAYFLTK